MIVFVHTTGSSNPPPPESVASLATTTSSGIFYQNTCIIMRCRYSIIIVDSYSILFCSQIKAIIL